MAKVDENPNFSFLFFAKVKQTGHKTYIIIRKSSRQIVEVEGIMIIFTCVKKSFI